MTTRARLLFIALTVLAVLPVAAQMQATSGSAADQVRQHERAVERCRQNRGIDCATPEALREWELLERSREQAIMEGSRNLRPAQPVPKTTRPASPQ